MSRQNVSDIDLFDPETTSLLARLPRQKIKTVFRHSVSHTAMRRGVQVEQRKESSKPHIPEQLQAGCFVPGLADARVSCNYAGCQEEIVVGEHVVWPVFVRDKEGNMCVFVSFFCSFACTLHALPDEEFAHA